MLNLARVDKRVDRALAATRRSETIIIAMSIGIFILGCAALMVSYWRQNPYIGGPSVVLQGFLYWPIREILRLRRDNLVLQTVPSIISGLPQKEAAIEIIKMLRYLRGEQS